MTERQRDRETERQRDRETERQRDRETDRQTEGKKHIFGYSQIFHYIFSDMGTCGSTVIESWRISRTS